MKVLILYTLPPDDVRAGRDAGEFDLTAAADGIACVLPSAEVAGVRGSVREILAILERAAAGTCGLQPL